MEAKMNRKIILFFATLLVFGMWAGNAVSEVPSVITFQGILADADGNPISGSHSAVFTFNDTLGLPHQLWSETHQVTFVNGFFAVRLGEINPFPQLNFDRQYWLGVSIDGGPELIPYVPMTSSPYAMRSKFLDNLTAENVTQFFQIAYSMPDADGDGYIKQSMGGNDCDDMNPTIHPGAVELCDGIDNNCNGQIDEGAFVYCMDPPPPNVAFAACQGGACVITECEFGWVDNNGIYSDGCEGNCVWVYIDNDCDGWVPAFDMGLDSVCLQGYGGCYTSWPSPHFGDCGPDDPEMHPGAEDRCDNIDNDCDMAVDEDPPPQDCPQDGVCGGSIAYCVDGSVVCDFGPNYEPVEVTCDGLDNDCDGEVDEDLPQQQCPLHVGVCAGSISYCVDGSIICDYGPYYEPVEVTCDGRDNDCDGMVDEGCPNPPKKEN
jgi:hypothetical protein